ncbi:MAG: outer membrane beta-barrel protein [Elusimicrobia bacterium]|nr:outer membrane beta-barrel protein [Elusimicrobiota bacterium]
MSNIRQAIGLLVLAFFVGGVSIASAQPATKETASLKVVAFVGELKLRVGSDIVELKPGSRAFDIPLGSEVTVLAGDVTLLAEGNMIAARPDDRFRFVRGQGQATIEVVSGSLSVTSQGVTRPLEPGGSLSWPVPGLTAEEPAAPPAQPVAQPVEPAAPPVEPVVPPAEPAAPPPTAAQPPAPAPPAPEAPVKEPPKGLWSSVFKTPGVRIQIELHPYYTLRETYDSNIYLVAPDKPNADVVGGGVVGSWITQNNLGVKLVMPLSRRHKLGAGYDFSASHYSKASKTNNALNSAVTTDYSYSGGRGFSASLSNSYSNTGDPAFTELTARERRWQNTTTGRADLEMSRRIYVFADGSHSISKYLSGSMGRLLNRYEQAFGGGAGLMLGPKTKVYASYHRNIIHYSAGRDANNKGNTLDVGVAGQITAKLKGAASMGFHGRRYDGATGSVKQKENTWVTSVDLAYAIARRTQASLLAYRRVNEATSGDNRFSEGTGLSLSLMHAWQKLTVGASGSWGVDRYPEAITMGGMTASRRDDLYSFGLMAGYKVKEWLSTGLSYTRMERHSIFTRQFNYGVNRTSLDLRVAF